MKSRFGILVVAAVVMLSSCGGGHSGGSDASAPSTTTVATRTITGTLIYTSGPCQIAGPYGWKVGDPVVITDGAGKQLAKGSVTTDDSQAGGTNCHLSWTVKGVPEGASGYKVQAIDEDPVAYNWSQLLKGPQLVK